MWSRPVRAPGPDTAIPVTCQHERPPAFRPPAGPEITGPPRGRRYAASEGQRVVPAGRLMPAGLLGVPGSAQAAAVARVALVPAAGLQLTLGLRPVVGVLAARTAWCAVFVLLLRAYACRVARYAGAEAVAVLGAVALCRGRGPGRRERARQSAHLPSHARACPGMSLSCRGVACGMARGVTSRPGACGLRAVSGWSAGPSES